MASAELLEIVETEFPRPLNIIDEFQELLVYIAKKLPAYISYTLETRKEIRGLEPDRGLEKEVDSYRIKSVNIRTKELAGSSSLEISDTFSDPDTVSKVIFSTTPGYDLEQLDESAVKLMKDVKKLIGDYFTEHPK
jgi:hypothetical protein